jgi:predicted regulator of Ras-like GTPase activity (Roadblock/LC7/MglB family)
MGRELCVGDLCQTMIEFKEGIIVVNLVGDNAILAVVACLKTPLGNIRFQVKKRLPEIMQALS